MKSPTPTFDRKEVQRKQDRGWKAVKQKDPLFSQNEDINEKPTKIITCYQGGCTRDRQEEETEVAT